MSIQMPCADAIRSLSVPSMWSAWVPPENAIIIAAVSVCIMTRNARRNRAVLLARVVHPQGQNSVEVVHELVQPHPVFGEPERVGVAFRVCDAEPEQARRNNPVGRVVVGVPPLRSAWKLPALEAHGVDN